MNENIFFDLKRLKHLGKNSIIGKTVRIRNPEKVVIGDNVIIDDFTYISGEVEIGDYVHIAAGCVMSASKKSIKMKPFSGLSAGCKVYGGSSNYLECGLDIPTIPEEYTYNVIYDDVVLERFSLIGANSIILPGTVVPEGMAVGANLVVKKKYDLKPWHVLIDNSGRQLARKGVEELLRRVSKLYSF